MSTFAVTGATGNLGGLVIDHLISLDVAANDIVPLVRSTDKAQRLRVGHMSPRVADFDDPDGFAKAIEGVDKLVLISPPTPNNAERLHQLHGAVMAAHKASIAQLAFVSLSDPEERAFGTEDAELAIEHSIRAADIPFTFLRNSVYLDEFAPDLSLAAASGELISATENRSMNCAPRHDQAAAIAGAVTQDGHLGATYNLVSPEPYTFDDLADILTVALGQQITHRTLPLDETVQKLILSGMDAEHARGYLPVYHGGIAAGRYRTTGRDIEKLSGYSGRPTPEYITQLIKGASQQG